MNFIFSVFLVFLCFSVQSAVRLGNGLVIPSVMLCHKTAPKSYEFKNYKERSLVFSLIEGGFYGEYQKLVNGEIHSACFVNETSSSRSGDLKAVFKKEGSDISILSINQQVIQRVKHVDFPKNFFDILFLSPSFENHQCLQMASLVQLPDVLNDIKEMYYNKANSVFYYLNNKNEIYYADCLCLSDQYSRLHHPITNIKNAHVLNIPVIWTFVLVFLKNYFYNARGNKRLQNSLRDVFLTNAGVVFLHLLFVYYGAIIFLCCKPNSGSAIILAKCLAAYHLGFHLAYTYSAYQQSTKKN